MYLYHGQSSDLFFRLEVYMYLYHRQSSDLFFRLEVYMYLYHGQSSDLFFSLGFIRTCTTDSLWTCFSG